MIAVLGGVAGRTLRQPDPVYQGQPLSFRLKGFDQDNQAGKPSFNEAIETVRDARTKLLGPTAVGATVGGGT